MQKLTFLTAAVHTNHASTSAPSAPFDITEIEYNADAEPFPTVTLTWHKTGAASYTTYLSRDLSDWGEDLDDSITADKDEMPEAERTCPP